MVAICAWVGLGLLYALWDNRAGAFTPSGFAMSWGIGMALVFFAFMLVGGGASVLTGQAGLER